jgi:probable F420-dependent oxidoreductase
MQLAFPIPHTVRIKAMTEPWEVNVTGADQTRMVKRAEVLGYDMVCVPEHFLIPNEHLELSGPHYFHSPAGMGYFAGATERIRVNSALTILPLHHPVVLAKALSTIDWLSGGRVTVTMGVGWLEGEFDMMGLPFHERGAMADEYLAAMIALWTEDSPSFEGKYVSFRDVAFEPKPFRKPHLPIWIGGDADPALRRAARFASGWIPFLTKMGDIPARLDFIKSQPTFKGGPFEVLYGLASGRLGAGHVPLDNPDARLGQGAQELIDKIGHLAALGVTITGVPIPSVSGVDAYLDHAQWVIEEIKPKIAAL